MCYKIIKKNSVKYLFMDFIISLAWEKWHLFTNHFSQPSTKSLEKSVSYTPFIYVFIMRFIKIHRVVFIELYLTGFKNLKFIILDALRQITCIVYVIGFIDWEIIMCNSIQNITNNIKMINKQNTWINKIFTLLSKKHELILPAEWFLDTWLQIWAGPMYEMDSINIFIDICKQNNKSENSNSDFRQ